MNISENDKIYVLKRKVVPQGLISACSEFNHCSFFGVHENKNKKFTHRLKEGNSGGIWKPLEGAQK